MNVSGFELHMQSPLLLALAVPAMLAVLALMRRTDRRTGRRRPRRRAALRLAMIALLALVLAGPSLSIRSDRTDVVLLVDRSDSAQQEGAQAALSRLAPLAGERGRLRVVDFAATPSQPRAWDDPQAQGLRTDSTDIAAALLAAGDALEGSGNGRIVLVSDGIATDGDALKAAQGIAGRGIRLDALLLAEAEPLPEVQTTALLLPESAVEGQRVSASVHVRSSESMEGVLRILDGETPVWQENATVLAGDNVLTAGLYASGEGTHTLRAEFIAEQDGIGGNNAAYAGLRVISAARVLVVDGTGEESGRLGALLEQGGYEVKVVQASQMPAELHELLDYALVILMNVNVRDLPQGGEALLDAYVREYGRSLLTTGGENTYIYGGMQDTALEALLPVSVSVAQEQSAEPVALMLVIDTTDSMTRGLDSGTPMDMARRGAAACVESLHGNDYAGVITFADDAAVLVEMTPMSEKDAVISAISGIETADASRLTRFTDALRVACDELSAFDQTQKKHVLFITDGSPVDANSGFESIVKEMRRSGITLSAIAVGRMVNVRKLLENLATLGGGRCYGVDSAYDLPQIMFTDTVLLQVEYTAKGAFLPTIGSRTFPIRDEKAVDQLYGYIRTTPKEGAAVSLRAPDGSPVYARWTVGEGLAASFMSDLSGGWSHNWLVSDGGKQLVLDMIGSLVPGTMAQSDVTLALSPGGTRALLTLGGGPQEALSVRAQIACPDGSGQDAVLERGAGNTFSGMVELRGEGCYTAALTWLDEAGKALDTREMTFAHNWSSEYDAVSNADGRAALASLCAACGGVMTEDAQALVNAGVQGTARSVDAVLPLSLLIMLLLMAELLLRKRLAD